VALALVLALALHCDGWDGYDPFHNLPEALLRDDRINTRMAFTINNTLTTMRVSAGEPIVFSYQPTDLTGQPEDLMGRIFVFSIYDNARTSYGQFEAANSPNTATWKLSGLVTEDLLGKSGLLWEVAERLDDGRDVIANGSLTIDMSAPTIIDYNTAPISRYITKIIRLNDITTKDVPVF